MIEAGVPVVPGSDGSVNTLEEAKACADKIGYPVLIKASAGGGGRGMRKAFSEEEFEDAYLTAKAEAKACFGDDDIFALIDIECDGIRAITPHGRDFLLDHAAIVALVF